MFTADSSIRWSDSEFNGARPTREHRPGDIDTTRRDDRPCGGWDCRGRPITAADDCLSTFTHPPERCIAAAVDRHAFLDRLDDLELIELLGIDRRRIVGQDDEIGELADLDRALVPPPRSAGRPARSSSP